MIFNSRRQNVMGDKKSVNKIDDIGKLDSQGAGYYFDAGLNIEQKDKLDKILNADEESLKQIKKIISRTADLYKIAHKEVTLKDAQVRPVMMSKYNPRFFLADSPGLGKTIMSLGMYSLYKNQCFVNNEKPKKVIVVTEGAHVIGFQKEWLRYGVPLLPLVNSSAGIIRALKKWNVDDYDGIIINWDGLKTNGFLDFYLRNADLFDYMVLDETRHIVNSKNMVAQVVNNMANKYNGGITRIVMLNGTPFQKAIYDFYEQFKILRPKLIPNKATIDNRYVIRGGREVYMRQASLYSNKQASVVRKQVGEITGYKNQEEFRDRLKYYFMARKKSDYSDSLPQHSHILHLVEMTKAQYKGLEDGEGISYLNSPKTSDPSADYSIKSNPKLKELLEFIPTVDDDRPLIYVYNKESQNGIKAELEKLGYKVAILNGDCSTEEKGEILTKFNEEKSLDMLVFNLETAINLPTSDRILFYDVPMLPYRTQQIMARIDRNNYKDKKFYDFFTYVDSPEMVNLIRFALFREENSNKFTGKDENVYQDLVEQLNTQFSEEKITAVNDMVRDLEDATMRNDSSSINKITHNIDKTLNTKAK